MRRALPITLVAVLLLVVGVLQLHQWGAPPVPLVGETLKIHFLDVGQGDCALIQTPDGRSVLVDAGDEAHSGEVVRYLAASGVNQIDLLVITHPHIDHVGGLPAVLEQFGVSRVLDAGWPHASGTYNAVLATIQSRKIDYELARDLRKPAVCPHVAFEVLWPPPGRRPGDEEDLNNGSIVLRIEYGVVAVLLAGDIQEDAEGKLLASAENLQSAVLKVAHHGSESGTSNEFLQVVKPAFAVISVGADNPYGHPSQAVLNRLAAIGAQVFRTDEQGAITVETDGKTIQVRSER
jgi:competence protein ComEC